MFSLAKEAHEAFEGLDVGRVVLLLQANNQSVSKPSAKSDFDVEAFASFFVVIAARDHRAEVVGNVAQFLDAEIVDDEGIEQMLETPTHIVFADRAGRLGHRNAVYIDQICNVFVKQCEQPWKVPRRPRHMGAIKHGLCVVQQHGLMPNKKAGRVLEVSQDPAAQRINKVCRAVQFWITNFSTN